MLSNVTGDYLLAGDSVNKKAGDLALKVPQSVEASALLYVASAKFKETQVDTLVVTENGKAVGLIDVQDLLGIDGY